MQMAQAEPEALQQVLPVSKVEMTWLSAIQDRPNGVWSQTRHPEYLADPPWFKVEAAGQFRRIGHLAGIDHLLPVERLADGADQGQIE